MIQSPSIAVNLSLVPTLLTEAQIYAAPKCLHYPWPTSLKGESFPWSLSTAPLQTTNVFPPSTPSSHCTQSRLCSVSGNCFSVSSGLAVMHASWNTPHTMCYETWQLIWTQSLPAWLVQWLTFPMVVIDGSEFPRAVFPRWLTGRPCQAACWVKGRKGSVWGRTKDDWLNRALNLWL